MNNKKFSRIKRPDFHDCSDICTCHNTNIIKQNGISYGTNSTKQNGIITLFDTRDGDNCYELKYYVSKCELVLVITNLHNSNCETIVISNNHKNPFNCPPTIPCITLDPCKPPVHPNKDFCKPPPHKPPCSNEEHCKCNDKNNCKCRDNCKCVKGCKGDKGDIGHHGIKGDEGEKGKKGDKGDRGCDGENGDRGKKGDTGDRGCDGEMGCKGAKGEKGPRGKSGAKGEPGPAGNDGERGKKGDKGDRGCDGISIKFVGVYDPCKVYYYNNIVRVENCQCDNKLYIYVGKKPSEPCKNTNIENVKKWVLLLEQCYRCSKCVSSSGESCDTSSTSDSNREPIKKIINEHKKYNESTNDVVDSVKEHVRPIYYKGKWKKMETYNINDLIKYKNNMYIAIKKNNNLKPSCESIFWELFFNESIKYKGVWQSEKIYYINDIVKLKHEIYIAIKNCTKGIPVNNTNYWALISKLYDGKIFDSDIIESYNDDIKHHHKSDVNCTSNEFESLTNIESLDFKNFTDTDFLNCKKDFYYAYKQNNSVYNTTCKKSKWNVPIIFDKTVEVGASFDNKKGQIIFNKMGTYKITVHINFNGMNLFKTSAFLLKPSDDPESNVYQKDRKIPSSNMLITCASQIKNHLHYCFLVKVKDALSTLIIMSEHQEKMKLLSEEKKITIYGKEKTWILIESME